MNLQDLTSHIEASHTSKLIILHEGDEYPDDTRALVLIKTDKGSWKVDVGGRKMAVNTSQMVELLAYIMAQR